MPKYEVTILANYGCTVTVEAENGKAARAAADDMLTDSLGEHEMKYREVLPMDCWLAVPQDEK